MKHFISELYKIKGLNGYYTSEAVQFINHSRNCCTAKNGDCYPAHSKVATSKPFRIYTNLERTNWFYGFLYGEKTWFETAEELAKYRAQVAIERIEWKKAQIAALEAEAARLRAEIGE